MLRQLRTPLASSSSTHHQSTSLALSGWPLSSYARASANHASDESQAVPSRVSPESSVYARSRAARRSDSGKLVVLYGAGRFSPLSLARVKTGVGFAPGTRTGSLITVTEGPRPRASDGRVSAAAVAALRLCSYTATLAGSEAISLFSSAGMAGSGSRFSL